YLFYYVIFSFVILSVFVFTITPTTYIYTLSLHDALPIFTQVLFKIVMLEYMLDKIVCILIGVSCLFFVCIRYINFTFFVKYESCKILRCLFRHIKIKIIPFL